tara:strand:+ start:1214 stop:1672 length:459 start_codon:yes stop_codon:yes gene_type:complete
MLRKSRNDDDLATEPSIQEQFEAFKTLGYDYIIYAETIKEFSCPSLGILGRIEKQACPVKADDALPLHLKRTFRTLQDYSIYGIYDLSMDFAAASEAKHHIPLSLADTLRTEILHVQKGCVPRHPLWKRLLGKSDPAPTLKDITLHFEDGPT